MMRLSFPQIVVLALFLVLESTLALTIMVGIVTLDGFVVMSLALVILFALLLTMLGRKSYS